MTRCLLVIAALSVALVLPAEIPALAAGGAGAQAPALPASKIQMDMTIYAGGITLGKLDMDASIRGGDYHVVSNLTTSGVVNAFWQAEIQATSSGKVGAKNLSPVLYDSFDINRTGKKQEVSLTYDSANPPRLFADPPYSTTGYEVKPEDQKATLDPLSAVMFIVSGAGTAGAPCTVTACRSSWSTSRTRWCPTCPSTTSRVAPCPRGICSRPATATSPSWATSRTTRSPSPRARGAWRACAR